MGEELPLWIKIAAFGFGCVLLVIGLAVDRRRKQKTGVNSEAAANFQAAVKSTEAAVKKLYEENPKSLMVQSKDKIYPYVVPSGYLQDLGDLPDGYIAPLGHELYVVFVYDLDGMVRLLNVLDLKQLDMKLDELRETAVQNLERLASERKVDIKMIGGPNRQPFMLFADHWAAATCIMLPALQPMTTQTLKTDEICISIPHRDVMLAFPKGNRQYRDSMRAMIREKEEADALKPLTWELFEFREGCIVPFFEPTS